MKEYRLTVEMENQFIRYLIQEEKSSHTVEKYQRDLKKFVQFLGGQEVTKDLVIEYKKSLSDRYAATSVNSMLASLNHFMQFAGWLEFKVKQIKLQRQVYCPEEKELTKEEYYRLVNTAKLMKKDRIGLIIQTICSTGIRISELIYITVDSVHTGVAFATCKGKSRQIFLPHKLRMLLMKYIRQNQIRQEMCIRDSLWPGQRNVCFFAWCGSHIWEPAPQPMSASTSGSGSS